MILTIFHQSGNAAECSTGFPVGPQNMCSTKSNSLPSSAIYQQTRPFSDNPISLDSNFFLLMTHCTTRCGICLALYVEVVPNWEGGRVSSYSSEVTLCSK